MNDVTSTSVSNTGTIRPTTASSHGPGRSLLKDTLGRHFSAETVKGKVRFGSVRSNSHDKREKGEEGDEEKEDNSDGEGNKRKSVLLLGKKVLGKLG